MQRFGRQRTTATEENVNDPFKIAFSVESYLENHANKFSGAFDPNCYLYLSRASDLFDLAEHGGQGFGAFKPALGELLVETLSPINARFMELKDDQEALDAILARGAAQAREAGRDTLDATYQALGLVRG